MTPAERDELRRKAEMKIEAEQLGMQPCCGAHAEWLDPQTVIGLLDESAALRALVRELGEALEWHVTRDCLVHESANPQKGRYRCSFCCRYGATQRAGIEHSRLCFATSDRALVERARWAGEAG